MGKVIFDINMSLDGFIAEANRRPEEPLGKGGERLHEWAFGNDERDREVLTGSVAGTGAVICGRRKYEESLPYGGADGPTGSTRLPVFVLCHETPADSPEGGVYTFVTDGIEAAGEKNVVVGGGAETGQQFIRAGLIDELPIHLVPVLSGGGTRMFENLGDEHIQLEPIQAIGTRAATHLRFRVVK